MFLGISFMEENFLLFPFFLEFKILMKLINFYNGAEWVHGVLLKSYFPLNPRADCQPGHCIRIISWSSKMYSSFMNDSALRNILPVTGYKFVRNGCANKENFLQSEPVHGPFNSNQTQEFSRRNFLGCLLSFRSSYYTKPRPLLIWLAKFISEMHSTERGKNF